jgi:hypothetical protein
MRNAKPGLYGNQLSSGRFCALWNSEGVSVLQHTSSCTDKTQLHEKEAFVFVGCDILSLSIFTLPADGL